jgi:hypothetical protein
MNVRSGDGRRVWGVTWWLRAWFTVLGAWFAVMAVLPWSDTAGFWDGWPVRLGSLGIGAALLLCAHRPRLELRDDVVLARGLVLSKRIPLTELVDARAGYHGIELMTRDGRHFTPTFVGEKSNLYLFLGRRGRADDIATTLLTAARPDSVPGRRRRAQP